MMLQSEVNVSKCFKKEVLHMNGIQSEYTQETPTASQKRNKVKRRMNRCINNSFTHDSVQQRKHEHQTQLLEHEFKPRPSAAAQHRRCKETRRWRKPKNKNRNLVKTSPPHEHEDWEQEILEVQTVMEEPEVHPYGPEDVVQRVLSLSISQRGLHPTRSRSEFIPSSCHPRPVSWLQRQSPTEPEQFADADQ